MLILFAIHKIYLTSTSSERYNFIKSNSRSEVSKLKIEWNRKYTTVSVYAILTALTIMLIGTAFLNFDAVRKFLSTLNGILAPVYIGFAIAYLANPIMKLSEKYIFKFPITSERRFRTKRSLSIAVAIVVLLLCVTVLFLMIIPQVVMSLSDLTEKLTYYIDSTITWLDDFLPDSIFNRNNLTMKNLLNTVNNFLKSNDISTLLSHVGSEGTTTIIEGSISAIKDYAPIILSYITGLANGLLNIVLGFFFAIYMLSSKEKLRAQSKKLIRALTEERTYHAIIELGHFSNKTFGGYLIGKVLDSLAVGIVMFIACSIFNVPYAILLSTLVAITNIIPVIGPFIGAIPGSLIIFIVDPSKVLVFIIINFIIQQIDGNIIVPKLLGETTGLDSLWVLFSITVMGGLWGIFGMFICVPIFAILYMIFKLIIEKKLSLKSLPMETNDYYAENEMMNFTDHEDNRFSFAARVKKTGEIIHANSLGTRIKNLFNKKKKRTSPSETPAKTKPENQPEKPSENDSES